MAKSDWGPFEAADTSDRYNIIYSSMGRGGSGKTRFALTAPEPIAYNLFDPSGLVGLMSDEMFKTKDVRVLDFSKRFNLAREKDKSERTKIALEMMHLFRAGWEVSLRKARTIVIDKEDALWEGSRYAHNEDFSAEPKEYYELNMAYRGLFQEAASAGVNLAVIRGVKEAWGKTGVNQRTGKPTYGGLGYDVPRGQKEVEELVQINLEHRWDDDQRAFITKVRDKCRVGNALELLGREFKNLDFLTLAVMLYPDADVEEWS